MNTVDGYAITSWERGYGDMEFVLDLDTIRLLPHLPATAMVQCDLAWPDHTPVRAVAPADPAAADGAGRRPRLAALAGTELEFIVFDTPTRTPHDPATAT